MKFLSIMIWCDMKLPCNQCGGRCCGPVPFPREKVLDLIEKGVISKKYEMIPIPTGNVIVVDGEMTSTCVFYKKGIGCSIYEDRPIICRLYGETPNLPCDYLANKKRKNHD